MASGRRVPGRRVRCAIGHDARYHGRHGGRRGQISREQAYSSVSSVVESLVLQRALRDSHPIDVRIAAVALLALDLASALASRSGFGFE